MNQLATGSARVFHDGTPIYLQIAERIREEILRGDLRGDLDEDGPVMSTNEYAAFLQVNPATVAKGFHELVDEGVLYKRRGIGMFVSPDARERLLARRRTRFFDEVVTDMLAEADTLGITLDQITAHLARSEDA